MGRSRSDTGGGGEGGGDKGAGTVDIGEEGDSGSEDGSDGRDAEGGDTSGKGSETVIGRSMTVVADTEGRRDEGGEVVARRSVGKVGNVLMEGHICRSNVLSPIWKVHTVALLSPRVADKHTLLCTRSQLGETRGVILDKGSAAEHSRW